MRLRSRSVEAEKVHLQRLPGFLSLQGSHLDVLSIKWTHIFLVHGGKRNKRIILNYFFCLNENLNGYILGDVVR